MRKGLANTRRTHITIRPISSARTLEGKSVETRMVGRADVHSPTFALSNTRGGRNCKKGTGVDFFQIDLWGWTN